MKFLSRMLKRYDGWVKGIGPFENYGAGFMERTGLNNQAINEAFRDAEIAFKRPHKPEAEWHRNEATQAKAYFREKQFEQLRESHNNDALRFETAAEAVRQSLEGERISRKVAARILKQKRKELVEKQAADFGR